MEGLAQMAWRTRHISIRWHVLHQVALGAEVRISDQMERHTG